MKTPKKPTTPKISPEISYDDIEAGRSPEPGRERVGSIEQQLDMCETGPYRGEEVLRHPEHKRRRKRERALDATEMMHVFRSDMAEEGREGSEESGDEHSSGLQGELEAHGSGIPGGMTEELAERDPSERGYRKRAA